MTPIQAVILAIVQGVTEFLPISSSGHLILVPYFLGWPDQGLLFDVAIHVGTLIAILLYFREQIGRMIVAWFRSVTQRESSPDSRLAWGLLWATIPVGVTGLLAHEFIEENFRSPLLVAGTLTVFGILLLFADLLGK